MWQEAAHARMKPPARAVASFWNILSACVYSNNPAALRPMRLLRIPEPFDHSEFLYEVKFDGFRALAHVNGHHCQLVT